jgi:hypothetical protein
MPGATQTEAINFANALVSVAGQFQALRQVCADLVKKYNSEAYNTIWNAMTTAALNANGTLATNDGTPNTAHPINVSGMPVRSATQLIDMVTFLNDFNSFLNNAAVGTAQRSQTIDDLGS